jgi:hypothetical protein
MDAAEMHYQEVANMNDGNFIYHLAFSFVLQIFN